MAENLQKKEDGTGVLPEQSSLLCHVGIDIRKIRDFGIGSYLRHLLKGLAESNGLFKYTLFGNEQDFKSVPGGDLYSFRPLLRHKRFPFQGKLQNGDGLSVFHSPHYLSPDPDRIPLVLTVHDLIHLYPPRVPPGYAQLFKCHIRLFDIAKRRYHQILAQDRLMKSIQRAAHIIAVSGTTADALVKIGVLPSRISKIYNCIDPIFFEAPSYAEIERVCKKVGVLPGTYFIYSGNDLYHKNISALLDAWRYLDTGDTDVPYLILVGPPRRLDLMDRIRRIGLDRRVNVLEYQGVDELVGLMKGALGLVTATLAEGFGLPVAEAMAVGIPVFCSDLPVLREITEGHATFFDPLNPGEIADTIKKYLKDPARSNDLVNAAADTAKRYRSTEFALLHREVYRRVLEGGSP